MARSATEQREYNRNKQRQYRAKQKNKKSPGAGNTPADVVSEGVPVASAGAVPVDELEIEVRQEEQPQEAPTSLKDRILLKLKGQSVEPAAAPIKRGRRKKKGDDNLLVTVMPTVIASFVATYSQQLLPDEYKVCAPMQEEVSGMIGPLFEILGRRVEVVGEASEDMLAVINSLVCTLMYGVRAYITYTDIKREAEEYEQQTPLRKANAYNRPLEREASLTDDTDSPGASLAGGLRSYQATAKGHPGTSVGGHGSAAIADDSENDVKRHGANSDAVSGQGEPSEAAKVAALFKRDITGRQQLGLLPRAV